MYYGGLIEQTLLFVFCTLLILINSILLYYAMESDWILLRKGIYIVLTHNVCFWIINFVFVSFLFLYQKPKIFHYCFCIHTGEHLIEYKTCTDVTLIFN